MGRNRASRAVITAALILPLGLGGCEAIGESYESAVAQEQRAERVLDDVLQLPEGTPGKADLVADARAAEAEAEQLRRALEGLQRDQLVRRGIDGAGKAARGDYVGLIEALGGLIVTGASAYVLSRRKTAKDIADLEARRDATREVQGIAPAHARSVELQASDAACAARQAREIAIAEQVARRLRTHVEAPMPSHLDAAAGRHLSPGVGAPAGYPMPPAEGPTAN